MTADPILGRQLNLDVWRYSMVFHVPITVAVIEGHARRRYRAAIHKLRVIVNSYQAAPGPRAHQRPELSIAEIPRQRVAARAGIHVDDHCLRPKDGAHRRAEILA